MNKVFCIGELLIDFINKDIGLGLKAGINFEKKAGGAPANVAVAINKLKGCSYFLGQVGSDSFGEFLLDILKEYKVNIDMVKRDGYTTLAFVAIDGNGERDFEFHRGSDGEYEFSNIKLDDISKNDIIHFGSATGFLDGKLKETYFRLKDFAVDNNIFISFDPNYRDTLISEGDKEEFVVDCKKFIKDSNFVKLSDEELVLITGEEDIKTGINKLHEIGAKIIAVTLGAKGTMISNGEKIAIVPSIQIDQIDSTGAGDAFVGGVLLQISKINGREKVSFEKWLEIISFGNRVGALTCTKYGAIDAIPQIEEL